MKKTFLLLLFVVISFVAVSCKAPQGAQLSGSLEEIMAEIYANADIDESEKFATHTEALSDANVVYMLGTAEVKFEEGFTSEPMINVNPHSIVLVRLADGADVEAAKKLIKENVDPRKWICVGVEESDVVVDNIGNIIILIMDKNSAAYHDAFKALPRQ